MLIQKSISLAEKSWFKVGGNAKYFVNPEKIDDLNEISNFIEKSACNVFILGKGANILIGDAGFDGLVIQPAFKSLSVDHEKGTITAQAGTCLNDLIEESLNNNLLGLHIFSDIPGSVGGSLYGNIHYFEYSLGDFLLEATIFNYKTNKYFTVDKNWFEFGYCLSKLKSNPYLLVSATFLLEKADDLKTAFTKGQRFEIIRHRQKRYPQNRTCGSFFKNFEATKAPLINGKKIPYIAYFLDKLGIKGELRVGKASVSHKHANMFETEIGATSEDVVILARKIQEMVFETFGVVPEPECQLIGFVKYPLL